MVDLRAVVMIADDMIPMLIGAGMSRHQATQIAQPYQQFAQAARAGDDPQATAQAQHFLTVSEDAQELPVVQKARSHAEEHLQRTAADRSAEPV